MKYDVVQYKKWNGDDTSHSPEFIYAITADKGKPIGLTLPEACESVGMGREWVVWVESLVGESAKEFDMTQITPRAVATTFSLFLKQWEEVEAGPPSIGHAIGEDGPEASGEAEYDVGWGYSATGEKRWQIEHVKSMNLVSKSFENRADAEGFLRWIARRAIAGHYKPTYLIHELPLWLLERDFARYKAEATVVEYRCNVCSHNAIAHMVKLNEGYSILRCEDCCSLSELFKDKAPESWIHRKESP